jgi:hypothetical protein
MSSAQISIFFSFFFCVPSSRTPPTAYGNDVTTCICKWTYGYTVITRARTDSIPARLQLCARPIAVGIGIRFFYFFQFIYRFCIPSRRKWQKTHCSQCSLPTIDVFGIIIISVAQISRPYVCSPNNRTLYFSSDACTTAQSADPIFGHVFSRQRLVLAEKWTGLGLAWPRSDRNGTTGDSPSDVTESAVSPFV